MQTRQAWALLALLAVLTALIVGHFAVVDPDPTAPMPQRPIASADDRTLGAPQTEVPRPRRVAPLGPGRRIAVPLPDGRTLDVRLWPSREAGAPLVVAAAADAADVPAWLPVLETLRAHRDAAVATLEGVAGAPPIADRTARVREQALLLAAALAALRVRPGAAPAPIAVLAADDAATAVLLYAAGHDEVSALVALSAAIDVPDLDVRDAVESIARRQVFVAFADKSESADAGRELLARLLNRRAVVVPGLHSGIALLSLPTLRGDLVGWLYAALGPVLARAPVAAPPLDSTPVAY
ncbi:MAG: hypothetical protein EXR79_06580 [Myxococcales bacterium]|nr:hypothetical protein [Myxococcales bacterium]